MQPVGLVALDFEGAGFDLAAAAESGFQFAQEVFQLGRVPSGGKSFEDENRFASAVRGGTPEEEAFGGVFFRRGLSRCRSIRCFAQRSEVKRCEGIGAQFGCGVGGDALLFFAGHGLQWWAAAEDGRPPKKRPLEGERPREPRAFLPILLPQRSQRFFLM